jgi:hypothetical protein
MELFSSPITQTSSVSADLRLIQTSDCGQAGDSTTRRVNVLITERLAAEEQTHLTFKEALNRMRTMHEGLQAQLKSIAPTENANARAQSGSPSDVPAPPAPSKDVTTEAMQSREKNAARPPAQIQAVRTGNVTTVQVAGFPLPKASRVRNHPSRSRVAAVPTAGSSQPTRPLKLNKAKHGPKKTVPPTDPPTTTSVSNSTGTDRSEAVARESPEHHQSSCDARPITTTTQERKTTVRPFTRPPPSADVLNFR